MVRGVYMPAIERWVTIGAYVRAVKLAKANPDAEFKQGLSCWWPVTGREIMQQFLAGVNERINQAVPYVERGIKA